MIEAPVLSMISIYRWYEIEHLCVPIRGNVLITAQNTIGKSTIIDALKYAYTTSTKFNRAANDHDERDVNSYLRCYKNGESTIDGRVTSNITMEYTRPNGNKFVIGVIIDSPRDKEARPTWYFKDCAIADLIFEENDMVLEKTPFKHKNNIEETVDGPTKARQRIQTKLNIKDMDAFVEKIDQMAAFNPPKNIKEFYKAILKEDEIKIGSLTQSVQLIQKLQNTLCHITESLKFLEDVKNLGDTYTTAVEKLEKRKLLGKLADIRQNEDKIIRNDKVLSDIEYENRALVTKIEELKATLKRDDEELKRLNQGDDPSEALRAEESKLTEENEKLANIIATVKDGVASLVAIFENLGAVREYGFLADIPTATASEELMALACRRTDTARVSAELSTIKALLDDVNDALVNELLNIATKRNEMEKERRTLKEEEAQLTSGLSKLPVAVEELKSAINKEFKALGISDEAKVLCDLVTSIKDTSWSGAIEAYLGGKRFAIIVEPQNAKIAREVQRRCKSYKTRLIATDWLPDVDTVSANSLFSLLEISNRNAYKYLATELNTVFMSETIEDFSKYKTAVTKDCFLYKAYTTQMMDPVTLCFGKKARDERLEAVREAIKDITVSLSDMGENEKMLNALKHRIKNLSLPTSNDELEAYNRFESNQIRFMEVEQEIQRLRSNPDFVEYLNKISALTKRIDDNTNILKNCEKKQTENDVRSEVLINQNADLRNLRLSKQTDFDSLITSSNFTLAELEAEYSALSDDNLKKLLSGSSEEYYTKTRDEAASNLRKSMAKYTGFSGTPLTCEADNLPEFMKEYNELKNDKYEEARKKLGDEIDAVTFDIKDTIFTGLHDRFRAARSIVNSINNNLKKSFESIDAGEYYKISLKATKDTELKYIYDLVTGAHDAFYIEDGETAQKVNTLIRDLIDKGSEIEEFQERICDYRNYFDCDILVCNSRTGEETSLIKRGNTTSGKETQAPYYIIASICIKLASKDGAPAVLFVDEAFNNCDTANIKKLMNFFKYQQVQLIMATPPEKVNALEEHIDELLPIAKDDEGIVVYTDVKYYKDGVCVDSE